MEYLICLVCALELLVMKQRLGNFSTSAKCTILLLNFTYQLFFSPLISPDGFKKKIDFHTIPSAYKNKGIDAIVFAEASLNIHTALPDGLIQLLDEQLFVSYKHMLPLKAAVPVCSSNSGPYCPHLQYRAILEDEGNQNYDLTHNYWNARKRVTEEYFSAYVQRYPIKHSNKWADVTEKKNATSAFDNYWIGKYALFGAPPPAASPTAVAQEELGLGYTFLNYKPQVYDGLPLHSEDYFYSPTAAFFGNGIGDILIHDRLTSTLVRAAEAAKAKSGELGELWSYKEDAAPTLGDFTEGQQFSSIDKPPLIASQPPPFCPGKQRVSVDASFLGWRGVSYLLELTQCLLCRFNNGTLPLLYRGNLPVNLQTKWTGEWRVERIEAQTLHPFAEVSVGGELYEHWTPIFVDTQLFTEAVSPMERVLTLRNMDTATLASYELQHTPALPNVPLLYTPSFDQFATLQSASGFLEFLSPVLISSLWVTFELSENSQYPKLMTVEGVRLLGLRKGVLQWLISIPLEDFDAQIPQHPDSHAILFDAMKLAKFTPHFRIDTLKFEYVYTSRKSASVLNRRTLAIGGIVLNTARRVQVYEKVRISGAKSHFTSTAGVHSMPLVLSERLPSPPPSEALPNEATHGPPGRTMGLNAFASLDTVKSEKRQSWESVDPSSHPSKPGGTQSLAYPKVEGEAPVFPAVILRPHDDQETRVLRLSQISIAFQQAPRRREVDSLPEKPSLHLEKQMLEEASNRIRRYSANAAEDMRLPLSRLGVYFQSLPIEAPVLSLNQLYARNLVFIKKPTAETIAAFINFYDRSNKFSRDLQAAKSNVDALRSIDKLFDNIFGKYQRIFPPYMDDFQVIHVIENGRKGTVYRARISPNKSVGSSRQNYPHMSEQEFLEQLENMDENSSEDAFIELESLEKITAEDDFLHEGGNFDDRRERNAPVVITESRRMPGQVEPAFNEVNVEKIVERLLSHLMTTRRKKEVQKAGSDEDAVAKEDVAGATEDVVELEESVDKNSVA